MVISQQMSPPELFRFDNGYIADPHWSDSNRIRNTAVLINRLLAELSVASTNDLTIERIQNAQNILDIGMGKGGLGLFLRQYLSYAGRLTGVDLYTYPDGCIDEMYDMALYGDAFDEKVLTPLKDAGPYDFVFGLNLHPKFAGRLIKPGLPSELTSAGSLIVVTCDVIPSVNGDIAFDYTDLNLANGGHVFLREI